jgi:signal transduction histidine kinase
MNQSSNKVSIFQKMITPPSIITNKTEQERLSLFLMMTLLHITINATGLILQVSISGLKRVSIILLLSLIVSVIGYILSRTKHYQIGAGITVVTSFISVIVINFIKFIPAQLILLAFPIFLVSTLLSKRISIISGIFTIVVALLIYPNLEYNITENLIALGILIFLILIAVIQSMIIRRYNDQLNDDFQELHIREERFRAAIDSSISAFMLCEAVRDKQNKIVDFKLLEMNHELERMIGINRKEILNQSVIVKFGDLMPKDIFNRGVKVVETSIPMVFEYVTPSLAHWYSIQLVKVNDGVAAIITNITERKIMEQAHLENEHLHLELQKAREMDEIKSTLMSTISHEFRTPMAIIMNNTDIISRYHHRLTEEQRLERIQGIKVQIRQLTNMLENLSQVIRGKTGKLEYHPDLIDLDDYCTTLFIQIKEMIGTNHRMELKMSGYLKGVYLDVTLIHQVMTNLLINAVKFSPSDSQVLLDIQGRDDDIQIIVKDEGIGIPEEDQTHIFEPFHRAGNSSTIRGTGLGLAIVKDCIEIHQGTIELKSKLHEGTTFILTFPRVSPQTLGVPNNENTVNVVK